MGWWEVGMLAGTAVLAAHAGWHRFGCPACRAARQAVAGWHPDWRVSGTRHRAREADRDVLAVFDREPRACRNPPPYLLVAVDRITGEATELPAAPDSPYILRGRK